MTNTSPGSDEIRWCPDGYLEKADKKSQLADTSMKIADLIFLFNGPTTLNEKFIIWYFT